MSEEKKIEVTYFKAKFHRRLFANLFDIIVLVFLSLSLFLGFRALVTSSGEYQAREDEITYNMVHSGLYKQNSDGSMTDIVSYLSSLDSNGSTKMNRSMETIETCSAFLLEKAGAEVQAEYLTQYDEFRLQKEYEGVPYFVKSGADVVRNSSCTALDITYFKNVYSPFIDEVAQGYLITRVPGHVEALKYQSTCLICLELIPAYVLGGLLVYLVPPLCFRRHRYTLGKALYRIALCDSNLLAVKGGRFLARFAIFYFAEYLLSMVTFGVPYLISFTMMLVTKGHQGFPDYLLGLFEVDVSKDKLYYDYDEVKLSTVTPYKKAVDFKRVEEE